MAGFRSAKHSAIRGRACAGGLCAAIVAAGVAGVLPTPLTQIAPATSPTVSLANTSSDVAITAQDYLTHQGLLPDDQWAAYPDSTFLTGDAQLATSQLDHEPSSLGTFLTTLNNDWWDFTHVGYLTDGAVADAGTALPASGVGPITHVAGMAPQAGESVSQLLAQVQAEGQLLIDNTTAIHHEILAMPVLGPDGHDIANEYGPASDVAQFQTEIGNALGALPPITAADEHNAFLVYELSTLLNGENSMNDTLVDLDTSWATDQIAELTADNAALIHNGDTIFDAAQGVVSYFAFEDFLDGIGL